MKNKWPLFAGIVLLTTGILLAVLTRYEILPKILIYGGVACKVFYAVRQMVKGRYRPGYELGLLTLGLVLFFTGSFLKKSGADFPYQSLMVPGILLKISFIVMFIKKTR
jgi:hypothetical protein